VRRVLVVHPRLSHVGGSNLVAAWALEALRESCVVTLATLRPVDLDAVNSSFGTSLRSSDFTLALAPVHIRGLLRAVRTEGALLDCRLTGRWAQDLDRRERFDVLLSTQNELDFGRRGIQYVNLPDAHGASRGAGGFTHRIPGLHPAFRAFCGRVGRSTRAGLLRNLFLADSENIARRIHALYGVESIVLHPPVTAGFPARAWAERRAGFAAVGRMHPSKRWEMAVAIVDALRARGHHVSLTLVGHREDAAYARRLQRLGDSRPWFRMRHDLSRRELAEEIVSHRYGLHTMEDEHFGIAPAELLAAGCLPFVHASGGPVEIVGAHPGLMFREVGDAAATIDAALGDPGLENELRAHAARQAERFSSARFAAALREIVETFR
jgi:glycosyltransferase involved in cell wall biosynthesis